MRLLGAVVGALVWPLLAWAEPRPLRTPTGKEGDLEHIFTPFVTPKAAGLGLGLSISRSIVEAHGGTIRAEHNADRGLSVHVELPCAGA